jgi:uncharacterized protein Yka (UPF0111/DUF47 family)
MERERRGKKEIVGQEIEREERECDDISQKENGKTFKKNLSIIFT